MKTAGTGEQLRGGHGNDGPKRRRATAGCVPLQGREPGCPPLRQALQLHACGVALRPQAPADGLAEEHASRS